MTRHEQAKRVLRRRFIALRSEDKPAARAECAALKHAAACMRLLENLVTEFEDTELRAPRRVSLDASKMVGFTEQAIQLIRGGGDGG